MVVSVVSTNTLLGVPAEAYSYGIQFAIYGIGVILATTFVGAFFVPLMFPLKMTSAHEVRNVSVSPDAPLLFVQNVSG